MKYFIVENDTSKRYESGFQEVVECSQNADTADVILVLGGDGAMLHAINHYHKLNKPFIGVNTGTRGYLMNNTDQPADFHQRLNDVRFHELWMLEAEVTTEKEHFTAYGFNDVWVERSDNQTLRMQITLDGVKQPSLLIGDGILFCTPQGSTGYNLALRGKAIAPGVPVLQLTPMSCVVDKSQLGSIILSDTSVVEVEFKQTKKRPGRFKCDGINHGLDPVQRFLIRKSTATVQLGLIEEFSFLYKVLSWQLKF